MKHTLLFLLILVFFVFNGLSDPIQIDLLLAEEISPPCITIKAEEDVYSDPQANNGAGPLWCFGSTCLVRCNDKVFISDMIRLDDCHPLNNCRCRLLRRDANDWTLYWSDNHRTREPSPLAIDPLKKRLFFSANPTLVTDKKAYNGPSQPEIIEIPIVDDFKNTNPKTFLPKWEGEPPFCEHSYRTLAADGINCELILFQNIGYTHAEWSFMDRKNQWSACGKIVWPIGEEYDGKPPLRLCYPCAALSERSLYFLGVGDIVEPVKSWQLYKKELTGRTWDYAFRRLFYTYCQDITNKKFDPWLEISNRDATAGHIFPCDLWIDGGKNAHILWYEQAIDTRLREKFFPNEKQTIGLYYAIIRDGKILHRTVIDEYHEGDNRAQPARGRFHITPNGSLYVVYYASGIVKDEKKPNTPQRSISENRILKIGQNGTVGPYTVIPFKKPFVDFFTASNRAGNAPSDIIDFLGTVGESQVIRYGSIIINKNNP